MVKVIKYIVEAVLLIASAPPVIAPQRFRYLEKRISKACLAGAAAVLVLSVADDVISAKQTAQLEARVAAAEEAVKPIPLPVRLRSLLEEIDPKIIPALSIGRDAFEGAITASQFTRLQTIANEDGAGDFITIDPASVRMGIGMGREGVTYHVAFKLDSRLVQ